MENRSDELEPPGTSEAGDYHTRSGRISRPPGIYQPHNGSTKYPDRAYYQGTDLNNEDNEDGVCLRLYYYNSEDMISKLNEGTFYRDSYFSSNVQIKEYNGVKSSIGQIKRWDDEDQYQLYHEAMIWLDFHGNEVDEFCFKAEQMSI